MGARERIGEFVGTVTDAASRASPARLFIATTVVALVLTGALSQVATAPLPPHVPSPSQVTVITKSETPAAGSQRVVRETRQAPSVPSPPQAESGNGQDDLTRAWTSARERLRSGMRPPEATRPPDDVPRAPDPSPAVAPVTPPAPPRPSVAASEPAPVVAREVTWTSVPHPEIRDRAEALLAKGDVTSARLWLASAADKGDAQAVYRLAETYDPEMLGAWRIVGMTSDKAKARSLYEKALTGGIDEARERLDRLGR